MMSTRFPFLFRLLRYRADFSASGHCVCQGEGKNTPGNPHFSLLSIKQSSVAPVQLQMFIKGLVTRMLWCEGPSED